MCGFAGIVTWDNRHRVHRDVLERMSARIAHRGPDGAGLWINHEQEATAERPQVGLVFRRLAIIDLDERANQPFTDGQGRWLVFNGEIYNYRKLRKELEGLLPNYSWRTQSDTEVLLASYAAWGEKCVDHLNGMFAFAIWDEGKSELFLARDPMGQKPLYFLEERDGPIIRSITFGSEAAVFNELPQRPRGDAFPLALYEYLRWGYNLLHPVSAPQAGQGETMRVRRDAHLKRPYFPHMVRGPSDKERERLSDSERVSQTRELVERSVRTQLVADVPVGCFLSGGIDSSVIATCMKWAVGSDQRVLTFSIGFDDPRYDETGYAAEVARHLGTEHHAFKVKPSAIDDLPKLAAVFGEPFADSSALPTHYLARETRKHVKVALSGDGGDELFGGYDRYRALSLAELVRRLPPPVYAVVAGRLTRRAAQLLPGVHPKSTMTRLKRFMSSIGLEAQAQYADFLSLFDEETLNQLLISPPRDGDKRFRMNYQEGRFWTYERTRGVVAAALAADRETYLPGDLLTKVDRCSMLHGLEVRSPFMDRELVRFASTLTTPQLLKGGPKRMLREAFAADLPAWVFKRKKMGFAVPIGDWFRTSLRSMLHDHLFAADSFAAAHFKTPVVRRLVDEHESLRTDHSQRLYALLMLELWWRTQQRVP